MNEGVKHYWSFSVDWAVKSACIELQVQSQGKKIVWRLFPKKPFLFLHVILLLCICKALFMARFGVHVISPEHLERNLTFIPHSTYIINTKTIHYTVKHHLCACIRATCFPLWVL